MISELAGIRIHDILLDLPNFPTIDVVLVKVPVIPPNSEVIRRRHDPRRANGIIRPNITDNRNFACESDIAEQELAEQRRERSSNEPEPKRMEKQLIASISVLLPTRKLIVYCERDTFFEAVAGPGGEANDVAIDLETKGHVEVFGNVRFGPKLLVAVFIEVGDLLDG